MNSNSRGGNMVRHGTSRSAGSPIHPDYHLFINSRNGIYASVQRVFMHRLALGKVVTSYDLGFVVENDIMYAVRDTVQTDPVVDAVIDLLGTAPLDSKLDYPCWQVTAKAAKLLNEQFDGRVHFWSEEARATWTAMINQ